MSNDGIELEPADYHLAVRRREHSDTPWRWEIWAAGKTKAVEQSKHHFATMSDATKAAEALRQAAIWRFDAFVAFVFVALVFLIAAGSAWEWWKLLRGTKPVVLHESEFIPLSRVESGRV